MIEQLTAMEVDIITRHTPDREPTKEELRALELEYPSNHELATCLEETQDTTERRPNRKIILEEIVNEVGNYKRIIFNDGEKTVPLYEDNPDFRTPTRVKKQDAIIKLKSELAELYQDIRFAKKQLAKHKADRPLRVKIRNIIASTTRKIYKLDK